MTMIFCPQCETYLPPELAACPTCGQPRPAAGLIQPIWSVGVAGTPAGPATRVGKQLLLPLHQADLGWPQAGLHRLNLADGQPLAPPIQLEAGQLLGGIQPWEGTKAGQAGSQDAASTGLILVSTRSSEPLGREGAVLALDLSGQERWCWRPGVQAVSAPAVVGETAWVTINTGLLVGLDLADGTEQTCLPLAVTPSLAAPVVMDQVAYVPTRGPRLLAVDLDGQPHWHFETDQGWLDQPPLLLGDRLYAVVNLIGRVVALARATGQPLWQVELGPKIGQQLSPPAADGQQLYVGTNKGLYAFNLETGQQVWHVATKRRIEAAPVVAGGMVYVAGHDHHLYALEAATGQEQWRYQAKARLEVAPLIIDNPPLAIVVDRKGHVTALNLLLSPETHQAAGRWLEAAEGYAAQGELLPAAELLQVHGEPFKAAQLWQTAGNLAQAAAQYELSGRWALAAELWEQLDRPVKQAEALVRQVRSLDEAGAEAEVQAQIWAAAERLFRSLRRFDRAAASRRELARCRQLPVFEIAVKPVNGLLFQAHSLVEFTVCNRGYGPAKNLIIQVVNKEMFAGALAQTRQIVTLGRNIPWVETLHVQPQEFGPQVPLQLRLSYQDSRGRSQQEEHCIHLTVGRDEADRQPGQVIQINSGGGTVMFDSTVSVAGDFTGRDQTANQHPPSDVALKKESKVSRKNDLQSLIRQKTRRLQKLKEQEAVKGVSVDPGILIQIEDLEAEIGELQAELDNLPAGDEDDAGRQESSTRREGSAAGDIHVGDHAQVGGDLFTGGQRVINSGGGAYIEGNVSTGGGDFVGRDQVKTTGLSAAEVAQLFDKIYDRIETDATLEPEDKANLKVEVEEVQTTVTKEEEVDESFLARRRRNIKRMAPDILELVVATLTNPAAGFSSVVTKVAKKIQESASSN